MSAPSSALAPRTGLPGDLLDNGYVLPPDLSYDEWAGILRLTDHIVEASPWWLVDVMAYGEQRFGEAHTQALPTADDDPEGASQARLKQAAWMASVWPRGTRVPGQSYTAHRVVAKLDHDDAVALLEARGEDGRRLPTRELARRAQEIERAIPAEACEPVCAAERPLSLEDLLPEWRARALATGQADGYLRALIDTSAEACFARWPE